MNEELELETYLIISPKRFGLVVFDKINLNNLYIKEIELKNVNDEINLMKLSEFLEDNIFKIEKKIGNFIKNIFLIIESNKINNLFIGIKKKPTKK